MKGGTVGTAIAAAALIFAAIELYRRRPARLIVKDPDGRTVVDLILRRSASEVAVREYMRSRRG